VSFRGKDKSKDDGIVKSDEEAKKRKMISGDPAYAAGGV
jgi:hypothetical protein